MNYATLESHVRVWLNLTRWRHPQMLSGRGESRIANNL
jgi:hypothetical protein